MAIFEGYERRIEKINCELAKYDIKDINDAKAICEGLARLASDPRWVQRHQVAEAHDARVTNRGIQASAAVAGALDGEHDLPDPQDLAVQRLNLGRGAGKHNIGSCHRRVNAHEGDGRLLGAIPR